VSDLTSGRLAEIRARHQALVDHTAAGDWRYDGSDAVLVFPAYGRATEVAIIGGKASSTEEKALGEWIAHSHRDVPDLLAEVERLRAELTELQGQNTQTEVNFETYVEGSISRENELLDLLRSLEDSVSHDFDSDACRERPAYQERLKPCQQREADHNEPCPACVLAAELAANPAT